MTTSRAARLGASAAYWASLESEVPFDTPISELAKRHPPVITALSAKGARSAAGLRTSAAHPRSEEIEIADVRPVIELTRDSIAAHLG